MENKIIYCFGDSHVNFFSSEIMNKKWAKYFKFFHIGPALCYNLCEDSSTTNSKFKILEILNREVSKNNYILFVFGEIDCRMHLAKKIIIKKVDATTVIKQCIERYFNFIKYIISLGYKNILIMGVIPHKKFDYTKLSEKEFLKNLGEIYGDSFQRNNIIKMFNIILEEKCKKNNCIFLSIADYLLNKKGIAKKLFYKDLIHLNKKATYAMIYEINNKMKNIYNIPMSEKDINKMLKYK